MKGIRYTIAEAALRVLLSVILISGSAWTAWFVYRSFWSLRAEDPKYRISAIVQTGPEKEALPTQLLAELLGLSADRYRNLYQFDLQNAEKTLMAFPVIAEAHLKRIPPETLFIDYTVRKPIAYLLDYSNTAIDAEMVAFPFSPFYSPKKLPWVYLGLGPEVSFRWGDRLPDLLKEKILRIFTLARSVPGIQIKNVDLSRADSLSLSEQRIVLTVEEWTDAGKKVEKTVILNPDAIEEGWTRYLSVKAWEGWQKAEQGTVLDLRILELGRVYNGG